jgi:cytochrome d ubiquinol oxidase subunit I
MDVEFWARLQFAFTIGFHYIYPPLSIGLGVVMVISESLYLWTKEDHYQSMARFWTRVFALTFSIGVATGIVMEFEFGTNWAAYSRFVGDIFGSALGAEGIFAFFLESGFLALLIFGWDRVSKGLHYFSTWMVCLGAHFSAVWIVVANSWMQTPQGYKLVQHPLGMRAEITDFWAMVFNPSSLQRLSHTLIGCWLAGAFLVISVSAWYLLKGRHRVFAYDSLKVALPFAFASLLLSAATGHWSAIEVAEYQPTKMAAFEGLFETQPQAPLSVVGWVDMAEQKVKGIEVPGLLSWLLYGDASHPVKGLNEYSQDLWPPVHLTFHSYHAMILLWGIMMGLVILSFNIAKQTQTGISRFSRIRLKWLVASIFFPMLGNQFGWMAAEVGRQPWIVWGLLKTKDGLSKTVTSDMVITSLVVFSLVYLLLFVLFIYLLNDKIRHGPQAYGSEEYRDPQTLFSSHKEG